MRKVCVYWGGPDIRRLPLGPGDFYGSDRVCDRSGLFAKICEFAERNRQRRIVSFSYFRDLIEEAGDQETAADYWNYLKLQLKRLEARWIAMEKPADANIASAAEQKKQRRNDT